MSLLALGTAQWGAGYGVTNAVGRLDDDTVGSIATAAIAAGVVAVDTAAGYGDAQRRMRPWATAFAITTKVSGAEPERIRPALLACLDDLGRESVEACLLHDWDSLDTTTQHQAARALEALRDEGMVKAVGVSVYDEGALETAEEAFGSLEAVQVPANALDRRLDTSAALTRLWEAGARVQVRSALLQGLLAADSPAELASHASVRAFLAAARSAGCAPLTLALAHVKALPWASEVVVGVTSAGELLEVVGAWDAAQPRLAASDLGCDDLALIDPRQWTAPDRMLP